MPWDLAVAAFGITAAILLVGGAILLRFQRDRYHFLLMQSALAQGITAFPGTAPAWLVSLRVGVLSLVLGLGLVGAGLTLIATIRYIDEAPSRPATQNVQNPAPDFRGPGQAPPGPGMDFPDNPQGFPPQGPPPRNGPPGRPGPRNDFAPQPQGQTPPPAAQPRPLANPALERWHHVQTQRTTGIVTLCTGAILALLGLVRIGFARVERTYTDAAPAASAPPTP